VFQLTYGTLFDNLIAMFHVGINVLKLVLQPLIITEHQLLSYIFYCIVYMLMRLVSNLEQLLEKRKIMC